MNYSQIWHHDNAYWQTISKQTMRDGYLLFTNPALPTRYDPNHAGMLRMHNDNDATNAIHDIIAFYEALGCDSVVYLDSLATPFTLPELLTTAGFVARREWGITNLMVLDDLVIPTATPRIHIARVLTDEQRHQWAQLDDVTPSSPPAEMYALRREELRHPAVQGYIAYLDGIPAGRCLTFSHDNISRVESVYVAEDMRRNGVARQLVAFASAEARRASATVYLFAMDGYHAEILYHALGFRTVMHDVTMTYVRERQD